MKKIKPFKVSKISTRIISDKLMREKRNTVSKVSESISIFNNSVPSMRKMKCKNKALKL